LWHSLLNYCDGQARYLPLLLGGNNILIKHFQYLFVLTLERAKTGDSQKKPDYSTFHIYLIFFMI
jgi:hypothetical protein